MRTAVVVTAMILLGGCGAHTDSAATVSRPRGTVTSSTFALLDGADAVDVRIADLGADLYRVTTPDGARVRPQVTIDGGIVHLHLTHHDGAGPADVTVLLSSDVRWRLDVEAGTGSLRADLRDGATDGVDVVGGSGSVTLALPDPHTARCPSG